MHEDDQATPETIRSRHRAARRPRTPVVVLLIGAVVLLAGLGAAGPPLPVTAAEVLPPPDTSAAGATGRLPDAGPLPLPVEPPPPDRVPLPGTDTASGSGLGIPETVLAAYRSAATTVDRTAPSCRLTWPLVAGIGKVESGHASGGAVAADGTTRRPILGPQLTGTGGNAAIPDTDAGALDHDATWDRAVGPTQFIPSSWRTYGADGNGDGRADPDNVFDAGLATARYLCASGGDLSGAAARHDAVFRYNHSEDYVATVLRWADAYASGALPVPDSTGTGSDDGLVALAAMPSSPLPTAGVVPTASGVRPAAPVPTAGGVPTSSAAGLPLPGTPVITSGAAAVAAPAPARPAPLATNTSSSAAPPSTPGSSTPAPSTPAPASSTGPSSSKPSSSKPSSSTPASSTPASSTPASSTPASSTPASSTPSTTMPSSTAPTSTSTSTGASSTKPSSTTRSSSATPTPAARCTGAVTTVARAFGVPAAQVSAASTAGPGTGRTTCTVRGPHGPLLVAVTADAGAPAPATPATGVSRTVAGGRTVLAVPVAAGVPADRARTALGAAAPGWE